MAAFRDQLISITPPTIAAKTYRHSFQQYKI
jgi:hypothetical protein